MEDLNIVLPDLTEDEQNVLKERYKCGYEDIQILEKIANSMGLTKDRVAEIESNALKKLRNPELREKFEEFIGEEIPYRDMLKERTQMYYLKFMESEEKSLITYLLFAIICKTFDYQTLFDYLEEHKDEILQSELCQQLICKLYNILYYDEYDNGTEVDNLHILPDLLNKTYKKLLLTNYNKQIEIDVLSKKEEEEVIENNTLDENIDRAIWTLYTAPKYS